jgi:hypothetical protein
MIFIKDKIASVIKGPFTLAIFAVICSAILNEWMD